MSFKQNQLYTFDQNDLTKAELRSKSKTDIISFILNNSPLNTLGPPSFYYEDEQNFRQRFRKTIEQRQQQKRQLGLQNQQPQHKQQLQFKILQSTKEMRQQLKEGSSNIQNQNTKIDLSESKSQNNQSQIIKSFEQFSQQMIGQNISDESKQKQINEKFRVMIQRRMRDIKHLRMPSRQSKTTFSNTDFDYYGDTRDIKHLLKTRQSGTPTLSQLYFETNLRQYSSKTRLNNTRSPWRYIPTTKVERTYDQGQDPMSKSYSNIYQSSLNNFTNNLNQSIDNPEKPIKENTTKYQDQFRDKNTNNIRHLFQDKNVDLNTKLWEGHLRNYQSDINSKQQLTLNGRYKDVKNN